MALALYETSLELPGFEKGGNSLVRSGMGGMDLQSLDKIKRFITENANLTVKIG